MSRSNLHLGDSRVAPGDGIRLRLIRDETGDCKIDRPLRENSLELKIPDKSEQLVPPETGTYEIEGTVRKSIYGEQDRVDYIFLEEDWKMEKVDDRLLRIDVSDKRGSESVSPGDHTDVDVDFDVETLSDVEVTSSQQNEQR